MPLCLKTDCNYTQTRFLLLKQRHICTYTWMNLHQQSPITRQGNVIQQNHSKSKSPILKDKWISHSLFSFPSLKEKRTPCLHIQEVLENTLGFLLVFFTAYENNDNGFLWQRLNFFVENTKLVKIIVKADMCRWFNTFFIHLLRMNGKHFTSIKNILNVYSQSNYDYNNKCITSKG